MSHILINKESLVLECFFDHQTWVVELSLCSGAKLTPYIKRKREQCMIRYDANNKVLDVRTFKLLGLSKKIF